MALTRLTANSIGTSAIDAEELASTGVTAGSYGNSTNIASFTVDADGRLTAASNTSIANLSITTLTTSGNVSIGGNLTVSGTTTTVNTETISLADNVIILNSNATGAASENAGIEIERGDDTNVVFRWNETSDVWQITTDGTNYYEILTTNSTIDPSKISPAVASLGTITSGTWQATNIGIAYGGTGASTAQAAINNLLPSQAVASGKYLTSDGTNVSWSTVDSLPSQTGNSGKYLTTDGSSASWATVDALPSQTGNSGKYLTTDGTTASWATLSTTLDGLSDVNTAGVADNYILSYDNATSTWIAEQGITDGTIIDGGNLDGPSAGSGVTVVSDVHSIDDLSDVDTSTTSPTNGQTLVWNSTSSKWVPSSSGGGISLTDLSVTDSGGDGSLSYNNTTGVFTYTGPSANEVRTHFTAGTGLNYSAGQYSIDNTVATLTDTQTLTNKTLTSPVISTIVNTGTLTLPTSTDTLVGRATTDTLTNKTLGATTISGHLIPSANITYDLGSSSYRFRDLYLSGSTISLGEATITASGSGIATGAIDNTPIGSTTPSTGAFTTLSSTGNVTVGGNLTINGTTITANSTNVSFVDSILELHNTTDSSPLITDNGKDIGIRFHYYKTSDKHAFLGWNNNDQTLEYISDGTETNGVFSGTFGTFKAGSFRFMGETSGSTTLQSTSAASGTLTLPAATDTLVGRDTTDTLTNKTIAAGSNTITGLTNSNLSGTAGITNDNLANSTISGVSLGSNLNALTISTGLSGTSYNGSAAVTIAIDSTVTTNTGTQTLTNKRINPRVGNNGATLSGTINIDADLFDQFNIIGITDAITIAAPTGTPVDGQKLIIRIEDAGVAEVITWTTGSSNSYRVIGTTLPTTTTASKTIYVGCIYNSADSFWDVIGVAQQA